MMVRLQKFMADCGIASRRKCEELIKLGNVSVDGKIVTEMGFKIDTEINEVVYGGKKVAASASAIYIALHKPVGYITSSDDQFGRPTVLDLLDGIDSRVFSVGRLDYNSSGLILITNDGGFAYKLTHPKHSIEKQYIVTVKEKPSKTAVIMLRNGVYLDGTKTKPADIKVLESNTHGTKLSVTISEGRNRQVRRMFEGIGHPVLTLVRVSVGHITLGGLQCGKYRFLSEDEINGW